jgi:hypothetical protein
MSLAAIARRLSKLDASNPEKAGLLTYPIGALYCAYEAQRCGFADRISHPNRWRVELDAALSAAQDIAKSRSPSKSTWTSIVHFNSALMRIDVGFERLIKHITGSTSCRIDYLVPLAKKKGISPTALEQWKKIRKYEVNSLKHRNPDALTKERIRFPELIKALDALVSLLESKL